MTRYGLAVYDLPGPELLQLAQAADRCGFDTLWVGEHVGVPLELVSEHPTAALGSVNPLHRSVLAPGTVLHDPLVVLAAVAAVTSRIRVATGVLVLPLHHPLLVARAVVTLQALAAGRFVLGVGSGWVAEEFAALGVPFEGRGRLLDDALDLLHDALAGRPVGSPAVQVSDAPVEVPLVVGGSSPAALRRAARRGDGWLSSGAAGVDEVLRSRDVIDAERTARGRAHLPFRCFGRLPGLEPHLVDRYRSEGVDDVVVWADHVWPREPQLSWAQKVEHLTARAADLGVTSVRAA
jgi:probable F420-dependent oxidoreductase